MLLYRIQFVLSLLLWKEGAHASLVNRELVKRALYNDDYFVSRIATNNKAQKKVTYRYHRVERNLGEYIWNRIGADIDGENPYDQFGYSLALSDDKTTLVVGGFRNDGNGADSGHVRVYSLDVSNSWVQVGADIDGKFADELFGTSVAVSSHGDTIVIGGTMNDSGEGTVRLYQLSDDQNWNQVGPDIRGDGIGDNFGRSVAVSDNGMIIAVGAPMYDSSTGQDFGLVRVFTLLENNSSFVQLGKDIIGENELNSFGFSLDLSGDGFSIVIGMAMSGVGAGSVRVFTYNTALDEWEQLGQVINDSAGMADYFGMSVAMSTMGTRIVVGAPFSDVNGKDSGLVSIYEYVNGTWSLLGSPIIGEAAGDTSGVSVDMSNDGNIIVVGGFMNTGENGMFSGHVRVYAYQQEGWKILGEDLDGEFSMDLYGRSVSISGDGKMVAIGGPLNDGAFGSDSGHVRVFGLETISIQPVAIPTFLPSTIPSKISTPPSTAPFPMDMAFENGRWSQYGQSLGGYKATRKLSMSSDGKYLSISEPNFSCENGRDCGKVEVFRLIDENWVMLGSPILERDANVQFGISQQISSDGKSIIIGSTAGFVSVYRFDGNDWSRVGDKILEENPNDLSGLSVSIGGADPESLVVAIGAPYNDGSAENSGHARVYELNSEDKWVQVGSDIDGKNAQDFFGIAVSLSGNGKIIAVSSASFPSLSYVKVFQRDPSREWRQIGNEIQSDDVASMFGSSLSLSRDGHVLAVGAPFANNGGPDSGAVYVYELSDDMWSQKAHPIYASAGDGLGFSVSLSDRGNVLAVGSSKTQTARVYHIAEENWVQVADVINGLESVSISGEGTRVAGSGFEYVKAYFFDLYTSEPSNVPSRTNDHGSRIPSTLPSKTYSPTLNNVSTPSKSSVPTNLPTSRPSDKNITVLSPAPSSANTMSLPSDQPTVVFSFAPSSAPTVSKRSESPSKVTSTNPSVDPTEDPTATFSNQPSSSKTSFPSEVPVHPPTEVPSKRYTLVPSTSLISHEPSYSNQSFAPSSGNTLSLPSDQPTVVPSDTSTTLPSPSFPPSIAPTSPKPSGSPSKSTSTIPSIDPTATPNASISPRPTTDGSSYPSTVSLQQESPTDLPSDLTSFVESPSSPPTDSALPSTSPLPTSNPPTSEPTLTVAPTHGPSISLSPSSASDRVLNLDYWSQVGDSIYGKRNGDRSGFSISLSNDGGCIVIGSPNSDLAETDSGDVRVFQKSDDGKWQQLGDILTGSNSNARFGTSVDISESCQTIVVGAILQFNDGGLRTGACGIYRLIEGRWRRIGQEIFGDMFGDRTGQSVALSADGNIVAVSSAFSDDTSKNIKDSGKVQLYKYSDPEDQLIQIGQDLKGNSTGDYFGFSLALSNSGDTVVIGVKGADTNGPNAENGKVQVFRLFNNQWLQIGQDLEGGNQNDQYGYSVSISADGNNIAIGAPFHDEDEGGVNAGLVQVFRFIESQWMQVGDDILGDDTESLSGWSLALSGDGTVIAIGSITDDAISGSDTGLVRVFKSIDQKWVQVGEGLNGDEAMDFFGYDVSLSDDGKNVAASGIDGGGSGVVKIFELLSMQYPSCLPSSSPSQSPSTTGIPSSIPSANPSESGNPTTSPSLMPSLIQSNIPSFEPTLEASQFPTYLSDQPSKTPTSTNPPTSSMSSEQPRTTLSPRPSVVSSNYGTTMPTAQPSRVSNEPSSSSPTMTHTSSNTDISSNVPTIVQSATVNPTSTAVPSSNEYWTQIAKLTGDSSGDYFGSAIAFSESAQTIAVGALFDDNRTGANAGSVKVFRYINNAYTKVGSTIEGNNDNDNLGASVALSSDGNTCIIGIPGFDGSSGSFSGAATVRTLSSNGQWIQKGSLIEGIQGGEKFGISVDISEDGNVIAIGAQLNDNDNGDSAGQVRIFEFRNVNGILNWVQVGSAILGENTGDGFGTALSLSGDGRTIGIGAPLNSITYYEGHVRVFRWTTEEEWVQLGTDIDGDVPIGKFGGHVSMSKDGNVVGIGMTAGSLHTVKVYKLINGEWSILGSPLSGYSVALSNDGLTAAVGTFTGKGQVLVMKYIDNNWVEVGEALVGEATSLLFGESVAISGDGSIVAVGAPNERGGSVNIFFDRISASATGWLRSGGQPNFVSYSSGTKLMSHVKHTTAMIIIAISLSL